MKVARRRGIGSVIATAVMVFLIVFTVSQLYINNLNQLDNYNQVAQSVFATAGQKQNERITVSNVAVHTVPGATVTVDLTITNSGGVTSHLVSIWMDDVITGTPHTRVPENVYLGPGLSTSINGLNTGIQASLNHQILVKVITELGNSASVELLPPGLGGTTLLTTATTQLVLIPPNPITSNDIIAQLTVTNTNSLGVAFTSLVPDICIVQGKVQPIISTLDSDGPSTNISGANVGGFGTLTDTNKNWATTSGSQWAGNIVYLTSGTGVGQTGRITSNTPTMLTISGPWSIPPDSTSTYVIRSDCHGGNPTLDSGTATSVGLNTLTDSNKNGIWTANEWIGYTVTITSGTGAVQTGTIVANTNTGQLTVAANWSPGIAIGSKYSIRISNCSTGTGSTNAAPVQCSLVQGPTPSSLTFLPPGGTIQFNWIYLINSLIPDSPITFASSYLNTTTTLGMITSPPSQNQIPFQSATVRGPGGASAASGGNFQQILGNLVISFSTFRYTQSGTPCTPPDPPTCWSSASAMPKSQKTILSISVTNLGSSSVMLDTGTVLYMIGLGGGSGGNQAFFIIQPTVCKVTSPTNWFQDPPSDSHVCAYTTGNLTIQPGTTGTVFFGANNPGSTSSNNSPSSGSYAVIFAFSGTSAGVPYGQSIPFVVVTTS